ncbi:MAG: alpha/beta hydrolase-fold protein [Solirubrobacteraceae bacterium]
MRRRRTLVAVVFAMVAIGAFAGGAAIVTARTGTDRGHARRAAGLASVTVQFSCPSAALSGTLPALVTLPAGYHSGSARYPVVYFLHGLPANRSAYLSYPFVASSLAQTRRRAIVVQPQGARSENSDREYLDWDAGENWPRAISHDLVNCVDARFRTVRSRFGRALIGLSAGGYGAFNIGLRALSTFGAVESWSGYFAATNPTGTTILNLGSTHANDDAVVPSGGSLRRMVGIWPTLIAFYVGAQDSRFLNMNKLYDAELTTAGVTHTFRIYPGGHSGTLWQSQAPTWLAMGFDALGAEAKLKPRSGGGGASALTR